MPQSRALPARHRDALGATVDFPATPLGRRAEHRNEGDGVGRLVVDAIQTRDYPIIQGVILLFSGVYVIVNLLVDLSYAYLDPRIRR